MRTAEPPLEEFIQQPIEPRTSRIEDFDPVALQKRRNPLLSQLLADIAAGQRQVLVSVSYT